MICQVSRFVRPVGLQIFQDEESFIQLAEKMNGLSVMRKFLKHIKPTISFKYLFFISRFEITLIFMHGEFVGFYIDIHLFLKSV